MTERSNARVAHALKEGFTRVASAPAVAIGLFAVLRLLGFEADEDWMILGPGARAAIAFLLFWAFAYGGVIDRYARNRPTRGFGFFGACGRHVMPLARLALLPLLVAYALRRFDPGMFTCSFIEGLVGVVVLFARVRLVVEDRRSAMGSLVAGVRFIVRNLPAVIVLWLASAVIQVVHSTVYSDLSMRSIGYPWASRVVGETSFLLAVCLQVLVPCAWGIALFQSRLAHAGYAAAPPAVWPESASAEAIANASPTIAP